MKHLLFPALLLLAGTAAAQRPRKLSPAPTLTVPTVYCELIHREQDAQQYIVELDYGQDRPTYVQDTALARTATIIRNFSPAAALNYLANHGWQVVGTYSGVFSETASRAHYLLRRTP